MSKFNLRAWCERFLDKSCNDIEAMKIASLVRSEAYKNGYSSDDVSSMYREINKERARKWLFLFIEIKSKHYIMIIMF